MKKDTTTSSPSPEISNSLPEKQPFEIQTPFRVTDLKQWVYCPRILYYSLCLPDVRPITEHIKAGIDAGKGEEGREERRSLRPYGLKQGRRDFNVSLASDRLGLHGVADMVIWLDETPGETHRPGEVIPVDYKFSNTPGEHFKLQLMAYGLLLEETAGVQAKHGFLYEIPLRKAIEVRFTPQLRRKLLTALTEMQSMLLSERMPEPTAQLGKCMNCEFRRFCNDVGY
jgi:CRISPR-associated exonuclease Cas4